MSHFYQPPQAIEISLGLDDAPRGLVWDATYHPVRVVALTWHEDRGWWLWHKWRAYYRLITHSGLAVYSYARLIPLGALDTLMPQIVHLVTTFTETTPDA